MRPRSKGNEAALRECGAVQGVELGYHRGGDGVCGREGADGGFALGGGGGAAGARGCVCGGDGAGLHGCVSCLHAEVAAQRGQWDEGGGMLHPARTGADLAAGGAGCSGRWVRSRCCLSTGRCWCWWWLSMCRCRRPARPLPMPNPRDVRQGADAGRAGDAGAAAAERVPAKAAAAEANPPRRRRRQR